MDKLTQLRVFVRVAERANFSAVAREMGITQPAVSKALTALEQQLQTRLVNRNTRHVALTTAGQQYFAHCRQMLAELDEAELELKAAQLELSGSLRITAPLPFGIRFIAPLVTQFQMLHPQLEVHLHLDDQRSQLIETPFDVAIRLGDAGSSGTIIRTLGHSPFLLVAASAYLARHPAPVTPDELGMHAALCYTHASQPQCWTLLDRQGNTWEQVVKGRFFSNNLAALHAAVLEGSGVACLPKWMVADDLQAGRLHRLLPAWHLPAFGLYAVYPSARQIPAKVRQFVAFVQAELYQEATLIISQNGLMSEYC